MLTSSQQEALRRQAQKSKATWHPTENPHGFATKPSLVQQRTMNALVRAGYLVRRTGFSGIDMFALTERGRAAA